MESEPLNEQQARLVEENLHLVNAHLRRNPQRSNEPQRERDDLYQEGCLGLIDAVRRYDPASGIAFGAYASRRIHQAVSQASYERFSTVRVPMRTQLKKRGQDQVRPVRPLSLQALELDPESRPTDRKTDPSARPTIAGRLREKYESAVQNARLAACKRAGRRGDRQRLVDEIIDHRLLVPDDEHKNSLRQIACRTHSSYSRVAGCEKKLVMHIGRVLEDDPEYRRLSSLAEESADGLQTVLDDDLADRFLKGRFEQTLSALSADQRGALLWQVVQLTGGDPRLLLCRLFAKLGGENKGALCDQAESLRGGGA